MGRVSCGFVIISHVVLGDATPVWEGAVLAALARAAAQPQQVGSSTSSWTPFITAGAGLIGVLIGGFVTVWSGHLMWKRQREADAVRWTRENQTRFHERRRELYAKFLASLAEVLPGANALSTRRLEASTAATPWPATERDRQRLEELVSKEREVLGLRWEISVIGSNRVKKAAEHLHEIQLRAFNAAVKGAHQDWPKLNEEFEAIGDRFVEVTREELGEPP